MNTVNISEDKPVAADRVFLAAEKTFQNIASMPGMVRHTDQSDLSLKAFVFILSKIILYILFIILRTSPVLKSFVCFTATWTGQGIVNRMIE